MKKIFIFIFIAWILVGCTAGKSYTADRIILSFDTTQLSQMEIENYHESYGSLPPEFVILVFESKVRLSRLYVENSSEVNMQTAIIIKQRIGDLWSTDLVVTMLNADYSLIQGNHENEFIFFLNNGLAVDVLIEESGNILMSIGRNLKQIDGKIYVLPYDAITWEETFQWYRDVCRRCAPIIIDDNNFRFSFENQNFLFTREANGVYSVQSYQP